MTKNGLHPWSLLKMLDIVGKPVKTLHPIQLKTCTSDKINFHLPEESWDASPDRSDLKPTQKPNDAASGIVRDSS